MFIELIIVIQEQVVICSLPAKKGVVMKLQKLTWKRRMAFIAMIMLAVSSCKKSSSGESGAQVAIKVEHGAIAGEIVQKTIGPAGGSIVTDDGRVNITVPAGAVSTNTVFSIQPVINTLRSGSGLSYRLQPEGVDFAQDLEVSIHYTDEDINGSNENFLFLAYQDAEGYWHRARKTTLDKTNKILKVKTKHFSDWTVEQSLRINVNGKKILSANEETLVEAYGDLLVKPELTDDNDDLLVSDNMIDNKNIKEWKRFYDGTITTLYPNTVVAKYKAPAKITTSSIVTVEVTLVDLINAASPNEAGNTGMVILRTELNLVGEEYFDWSIKGQKFTGGTFTAASANGITTVSTYNGNNTLSIMLKGAYEGSYSSADMNNAGSMAVTVTRDQGKEIYNNSYKPCGSDKAQYQNGNLTITKLEQSGGYIEGNISANLVYFKDCSTTNGTLLGTFRIKRK